MLDLKGIWVFNGFGISDRNRVQYLIREKGSNKWLYRNRLRISYRIKFDRLRIRPFLEDEVFILQGRGFSQNRATIGMVFSPDNWIDIDLYYRLRHLKIDGHFRRQNIFGLYLSFLF